MSLAAQSTAVMLVTWVLWIVVPLALLRNGRVLLAGLGMLFVCFLPLLWQGFFTDSDAPGFGLMLLVMAPIPLLLIGIGLILVIVRATRRALSKLQI